MKLVLGIVASATLAALSVAAGCSANDGAPNTPPATANDSGAGDAGEPDGATDGATAQPTGRQLAGGDHAFVLGITSDDYVVYGDDQRADSPVYYAAPLAGGAATKLGTYRQSGTWVFGPEALLLDANSNRVSVWTSAHGVVKVSDDGDPRAVGVSHDGGSRLVFFEYRTGDAGTSATDEDVFLIDTDGTGRTKLASSSGTCDMDANFAGDYAVIAICAPSTDVDGGAAVGSTTQILTFAKGSTTPALTVPSVNLGRLLVTSDAHGGQILAVTPAGLTVFSAAGGAGTLIDAAGVEGTFVDQGDAVVYRTSDLTLKRSSIASPSAVVLASGIAATYLLEVSHDGKNLLFLTSTTVNTLDLGPMYVASATGPSTATLLTKSQSAKGLQLFTNDSAHVLFTDGALESAPAAGGQRAMISKDGKFGIPLVGSKVVALDHSGTGPTGDWADIMLADTATTDAPTMIAPQATWLWANPAGTKVVYTWQRQPGSASQGIYVVDVP